MGMEWKDCSQTKPDNKGWYLVWVDLYSVQEGYPDTDYWDGSNWRYIDTAITWWCEITLPPPVNNKQEEQ